MHQLELPRETDEARERERCKGKWRAPEAPTGTGCRAPGTLAAPIRMEPEEGAPSMLSMALSK